MLVIVVLITLTSRAQVFGLVGSRTGAILGDPQGKYTAREICKYFIPDFSNGKNHNEFQKAFGRLMVDGGFEGGGQRQWLVISVGQRGEWRS
jgi:hypothetical protein